MAEANTGRHLYFLHQTPTNFIIENAVAYEGENLAYHLEVVAQNASDVNCLWLHSGTHKP